MIRHQEPSTVMAVNRSAPNVVKDVIDGFSIFIVSDDLKFPVTTGVVYVSEQKTGRTETFYLWSGYEVWQPEAREHLRAAMVAGVQPELINDERRCVNRDQE